MNVCAPEVPGREQAYHIIYPCGKMAASPLNTPCIYKERAEDTGQDILKGGEKAAETSESTLGPLDSGEYPDIDTHVHTHIHVCYFHVYMYMLLVN